MSGVGEAKAALSPQRSWLRFSGRRVREGRRAIQLG